MTIRRVDNDQDANGRGNMQAQTQPEQPLGIGQTCASVAGRRSGGGGGGTQADEGAATAAGARAYGPQRSGQ